MKKEKIVTEAIQILTSFQAWHYKVVPKSISERTITFITGKNENNADIKEELEILLDKEVFFEYRDEKEINELLSKYYLNKKDTNQYNKVVDFNNDDFVEQLLSEAKDIGSSDIHIEAYEEKCRIRMRIDGKLNERYIIKKDDYQAGINKIKIRANLDIAEKRLPQDGRIKYSSIGSHASTDVRVSILPTLHGEKIVLRLLNRSAEMIDIRELGMTKLQITSYLEAIRKPHGIILISGPTGSGKTTTLYATLKILNDIKSNIVTIEDPIEYTLEGINQVQLKEGIGMTYAKALRTFLRQDPDIIMVGEIRDEETAKMAIRSALTGHLVLSTIHTNSAWGIIGRLIDMGVPSFLLANSLNLAMAQRLVRKLCPFCKEKKTFHEDMFPKGFTPQRKVNEHYIAQGCNECYFTGYKGRQAIFEVISIDSYLKEKIKTKTLNISKINIKGYTSLSNEAFELFAKGITTLEEIYPILSDNS